MSSGVLSAAEANVEPGLRFVTTATCRLIGIQEFTVAVLTDAEGYACELRRSNSLTSSHKQGTVPLDCM